MGKIIGVLSLKGGVGKTSSVVSLGASLASLGKKVLLVDANFSSPNLGIHLNIIDPVQTLHHVIGDNSAIHSAIHELDYFHVLPASVFPHKIIDPLELKKKLKDIKNLYDFILIDSSPALNRETLATMTASDELFVVSTPDFSTLSMTLKAIKLAKQKGTPISGLILNKVYNKKFELSLDNIEKTGEVPILAVVPHDVNVLRAQANFVPAVYYKSNSNSSLEYKRLASCLANEIFKEPFKLKTVFKVNPKKEQVNRDIFYNAVF
ncbi:MAG: AAA family ATPase [Nanoarchaeota archaeon]|nr:AAA family ATPase [Nanoarchaeota archaeon]